MALDGYLFPLIFLISYLYPHVVLRINYFCTIGHIGGKLRMRESSGRTGDAVGGRERFRVGFGLGVATRSVNRIKIGPVLGFAIVPILRLKAFL